MYPQLPCLREYFALEGIADKHINEQQLQLRQDANGTGNITDATKEANNINDFAGGALVSEMNRLKARLGLTGSFHINSLIRQACDEAVYGYGFTFEGDRFLPATVPHRIENGFAYGVGDRSRLPTTGFSAKGDGVNDWASAGAIMQTMNTSILLYTRFQKVSTDAGVKVLFATGTFGNGTGFGLAFNANKIQVQLRSNVPTVYTVTGNDDLVNDTWYHAAFTMKTSGVMNIWVAPTGQELVKQTDTDTMTDDVALFDDPTDLSFWARLLSGSISPLQFGDQNIGDAAIIFGTGDLSDDEIKSLFRAVDCKKFSFSERVGYEFINQVGDRTQDIFNDNRTRDLIFDATDTPTWENGEDAPAPTNERGGTKGIRFQPSDEFTDFGTSANASVGGTAKRTFKVKLVSFSFSTTQVYWQIFQVVGNNRAFQFGIDVFANPFIVLSSDGEAGTTNSYFATNLTATINTNIELQAVVLPSDSVIFTLNGVSQTVSIVETGIFAGSTSSLKQGSDIVSFDAMNAIIYESSILDENDDIIIEPDFNTALIGVIQHSAGSANPIGTLTGGAAITYLPLVVGTGLAVFGLPPTGLPNIPVAQRLKMTGGACLNPNKLNHGRIASGWSYEPHNKPITGIIKGELFNGTFQMVFNVGDNPALQDTMMLRIANNTRDLWIQVLVGGVSKIDYRYIGFFTEGEEFQYELTPVFDGATGLKMLLKKRTDLTIPFSLHPVVVPSSTSPDIAISTTTSYDEVSFFGREDNVQELQGEAGAMSFNNEPARIFYFEEQDGSSKSADGSRTVVFSDNAIWGGTMDLHGYNTERLGGNKATSRFVAQAIDANGVPTGLDLDGNTIANLAMPDTGLELDGTFDSTPELEGATATMITDIDLDFTYINSDVNPIDYLKDLLFFLLTTQSGYPAGERQKILDFTNNNP